LKRNNCISWLTCFFGLSLFAHSQATPTATGRGGAMQIGVDASYIQPDYGPKSAKGLGIYGTYDLTQHFGVEGNIHFSVWTPSDFAENSYLFGPRYVFHKNRFHPYAKVLFGIATFSTQFDNRPNYLLKYGVYDFGGGLDIKATRRVNIRAIDFEYQKWPNFSPNSLSPYLVTIGAAYNFR